MTRLRCFVSNCSAMLLVLIMAAITAMALSGCNMISGLGEDIHRGAEWTKERFDDGFRSDRDR